MYSNPIAFAELAIRNQITAALADAIKAGELKEAALPDYEIGLPREKNHGDLYSNFAMQGARAFGVAPRKIAESICSRISASDIIDRIEIADPGFVNFFLAENWYASVLKSIEVEAALYGRTDGRKGEKVMVEFVSANPTGPMHMGNARGGVIGDTIASALEYTGCDVTREFYVNDAGNQVDLLSRSLEVRYIQHFKGEDAMEFPDDGYHGDDVKLIAAEYANEHGESLLDVSESDRRKALVTYALTRNIKNMQRDLERYRISYDVWFFESTLHESGYVAETIDKMVERGCTYEKEGALWFRATDFGCEKDEVMRRANGFFTYYAVDIAYHRNKFEKRGFDRVIDVLGADHHGHTVRFRGSMTALGINADGLDFVLMQLVKLMRDGEVVRMSKRTGKAISLTDLLDEIPVDAARFFFASRTPDSPMDFDLGLAIKQESDNPVFYVQYAHARICSILRGAEESLLIPADQCDLSLLSAPEERELIKCLASLPSEIIAAATLYDPARITRYVLDCATSFHKFYNACRVRCEDTALSSARLALCRATKQVIANVCEMLKISAPEQM